MNLEQIKPVERLVEILHPGTGKPVGLTISMLSLDDPELRKLRDKIEQENLNAQSRGKKIKLEDIKNNRLKIAFTAITSWEWKDDLTFKGEKPDLNQVNLKAVFEELPWIQDQIEEEISREEDFFPTSE